MASLGFYPIAKPISKKESIYSCRHEEAKDCTIKRLLDIFNPLMTTGPVMSIELSCLLVELCFRSILKHSC